MSALAFCLLPPKLPEGRLSSNKTQPKRAVILRTRSAARGGRICGCRSPVVRSKLPYRRQPVRFTPRTDSRMGVGCGGLHPSVHKPDSVGVDGQCVRVRCSTPSTESSPRSPRSRVYYRLSGSFGCGERLTAWRWLLLRVVIPKRAPWGPSQMGQASEGSAFAFCLLRRNFLDAGHRPSSMHGPAC
jgi:hypothetical protein